ncbi:ABC transporter substrate-binding protein [Helcobacillus massiliensis]|uniref:Polar amino acid transport system substrate-binding protein n=1 Tax=Helcobacillus massiliensis TaxID=521392 RepID=A0A839QUC2_9MICO|nr:polar amino acid transport system substrate-binding protein [Helcobacillus massiliensis]
MPHPTITGASPSRRALMRGLIGAAVGLPAAGAVTGCTTASVTLAKETNAVPEVDLSPIAEVPEIAALVPEHIRSKGTLVNGCAANYAPGEFLSNGEPVGYDIDVFNAIGRVLGMGTRTDNAVFAQIIPAIGSKYDLGMSGFTINAERLAAVSMISYFEAGISYAVATGNPYRIDPSALCGTTPAVQVGTYQEELVRAADQECRDAGADGLRILAYESNNDAVTNVAGKKADIFIADSPVTSYAIARSRGTLEQIGDIQESALNGIAVAKSEPEFAEAVRAAVQHLIDSGHMLRIMQAWGTESGMIDNAEINPADAG